MTIPSQSQLRMYLFGSPRIEQEHQPIQVDTRKATALMAYLVMTREVQSREALAALLWPEYDETRARAALRRTLSALKKGLGGEYLEISRETIGLLPDREIWLDVERFHQCLAVGRTHGHIPDGVCQACLPHLEQAFELYRADFMEGFTLRDSPNFDEWQFFQTESLRRGLAGALEKLVRGYSEGGGFSLAITRANQWLSLDPLREEAHRNLMSLYAWAGQRSAALQQYRDCVRILDKELGVPPLDETTELYHMIKEDHLAPPSRLEWEAAPPPAVAGLAPGLADVRLPPGRLVYPLVGRDRDWEALLRTYQEIGKDGRLIVLEGEAGIGKTRLGEELLAYVQSRGGATLIGRSYEGETGLAYGPFSEGLRIALGRPGASDRLATLSRHWLSESVRLVPELLDLVPGLEPPASLEDPGAQVRFFEGVTRVILAVCAGPPPGLIFLDDFHWADEASLALLTYLVRRLRENPVGLLVNLRGGDLPPNPQLRTLAAEARRAGTGMHHSLNRLSHQEVASLIHAVEREDLPEEVVDRLFEESEGLPFFVVEYLAIREQNRGGRPEGEWALPGGVRDLLISRLGGVGQMSAQLLAGAAIIGRSFDYETLRTASGRSEEETVTGLENLLARGLIREMGGEDGSQGPIYDFSLEKLRQLVYEQTSLARRRLLHRRVAEAMQGRALRGQEAGAHAAQIAHHYQLAGQEAKAAEYFVLAGERARRLYANREALAHFEAALALNYPAPSMLHQAIGDLHTLQGDYPAALASYETAAALGPADRLAQLEHRLGDVHRRQGDWELAEIHFQAALAALGESGPRGERGRVYADWSLAAHHQGQDRRAQEYARQALEQAEAAQDEQALAQAHNILGILARSQGDLPGSRNHLALSLELAERLGDPGIQVAARNNLALAYQTEGELERAHDLLESALALCVSQGDRHREAALHNNLADLLYTVGRPEDAMTHLKRAVVIFAEIGVQAGDWQPEIWKLMEW